LPRARPRARRRLRRGRRWRRGSGQASWGELTVKEGVVVSGPTILTAGQGDRVIIKVISDAPDTLYVSGYDVSTDLVKNVEGGIIFYAATTGRFALELQNAQTPLGTLEVLPRE
ncbi:MAG: hypothetical protein MUD00_03205, partial [Candidatus Pacebacteria bacterium]|nr:hypothetical protein [Candidatus Paceibacterota bacterium]